MKRLTNTNKQCTKQRTTWAGTKPVEAAPVARMAKTDTTVTIVGVSAITFGTTNPVPGWASDGR